MWKAWVPVSILLIASPSWAADAVPALDCDDDELVACLRTVDEEFRECERECIEEFPDDDGRYDVCRNDCGDPREVRRGCYDRHCVEN